MAETPTLWQLRFSHYNEKARWALDYKRIPHVRRSSLPAIHAFRAVAMTRARTMPILVLDGTAIGDSARIIDALEAKGAGPSLYPSAPRERERALELQRYFDREVGAEVRRVFFFHMLGDEPDAVCEMYTRRLRSPARVAYTAAFPLVKAATRRALTVTPDETERSLRRAREGLDRIEAELGDRDYLVDDSFSVADLTAASLYFPLVRPPEFQYDYPTRWSPAYERIRDSMSDRRAFAWIAETWRRHRGASAAVSD